MHAASITRFGAAGAVALGWVLAQSPAAPASVILPGNQKLEQVDFERHVMGLFGRLGCNGGSCHGSFQGKGGFRLSLFGYDPQMDYAAVAREALGRRIDPVNPDSSLLLLKATGAIEHGGGRRLSLGSWQYQVLREWITAGAIWKKGSGQVTGVTVSPAEYAFQKPNQTGQLTVKARFGDGSEENITTFTDFRILDDAVAEVSNLGQVGALRAGDTAVVVSYRGNVVPVRVLVPREAKMGFVYPKVPEVNFIDREVFAKLKRLNILPSELSSDTEFLRRVTIDTIGSLPTPDEVRKFVADKDSNKRAKKIDELLDHPLHAALWATKFCDITGNNTDALENPQQLKTKRSQAWYEWFRKRLAENMPYDQIVEGVLCATSRDDLEPEEFVKQVTAIDDAMGKGFETPYPERKSLDLFWRRQQNVPIEQWGEKTAAAFLGIRLECAQCHKHPFDRWTQLDYRAHANVFGQVAVGISPEAKKAIDDENARRRAAVPAGRNNNQIIQVREVYVQATPRGTMPHPETNGPLPPKALGGPELKFESGKDLRVALFQWMRQPENPFFARSFANRIWGHYFGQGIVDPVDDFSLANPPSNPQLLDALGQEFVKKNFDIRHIERLILNSRTYQLSSKLNDTNKLDRNNYSHSYLRPMLAEVVVDVLNTALGTTENFGPEAPAGSRAIEVGASRLQNNPFVAYAFRLFGRSPRAAACDCERSMDPALPQKLFLMTDPGLLLKVERGRVQEIIRSKMTDEEALEELCLATVSRLPSAEEKELFAAYRAGGKDRAKALTDTAWALINTREFILNH